MNVLWVITESDIEDVREFCKEQYNPFLQNRINRNVKRNNIQINRDIIIKTMLMCLLDSHHESDLDSSKDAFFMKKPFILSHQFLLQEPDIENRVRELLNINGLERYSGKIPKYFSYNFYHLEVTNWALLTKLYNCLRNDSTKHTERELADSIDHMFKGFGSKQAREFLQILGLSKYEIPIDTRTIKWMKEFGFPVSFSSIALQDKSFYHFISDGIQLLCEKAHIYPCELDAAISSNFDKEQYYADHSQNMLEKGDLEEALNAASQIGDDRLQKQSQGYVVPDSFTHGTSAQRIKWFRKGYQSNDLNDASTIFQVDQP